MSKRIEMLALDVDGTLVEADNRVAPEVGLAIADAVRAGIRVCLATGRSYRETVDVWRQIPWPQRHPHEAMALVGGALVSEPGTARTLYHKPIAPDDAAEFADALLEAGHSPLGIVDAWRWGFDYVTIPGKDFDRVRQEWFAQVPDVVVREVRTLGQQGQPPLLRVNAMVDADLAPRLEASMRERFGERLHIHAILAPNYGVTIVEAFSPRASKLQAVRYIAQAHRIGMGQVAAVGDDVNDMQLLEGAGLGVAMPAAPAAVKDVADATADAGLAAFIRSLL